jgi:signal transduction histidine kinase
VNLIDHYRPVLRIFSCAGFLFVSGESHDGRRVLVRIMPYRTMDKMINGVVITCNDITSAKKIEDELREEIARLKA